MKRSRKGLRRRYGRASSNKKQFIDIRYGYHVTDTMAAELSRKAGRKTLPDSGYEAVVELPNGALGWLARTNVSTDAYGFKAPKRGRVWYVRPKSQPEGNERKFYDYVRDR